MEKFDFEKPIEAEVALEDSDDETISHNGGSNSISENGTEKEHYNMPDIDDLIKQKDTPSTITSLTSTNNQSSNDFEISINILENKTPKKRKSRNSNSKDKKISKKQEECLRNEMTSEKLLPLDANYHLPAISNNNGHERRTETKLQSSLKIYADLVSSVCQNLVMFAKMIQYYQKIYLDPNKFHETITKNKHYYFSLTHTTVETVFIPRKDNVAFRNHVIKLALEFAKEENVQCEFRDMELLFCDMISWSEWKKTQMQQIRDTVNSRLQRKAHTEINPSVSESKKYDSKLNYVNSNYGTVNTNRNVICTTLLHAPNYSQHHSNTLIQVQSNNNQQMGDICLLNQTSTPQLANSSIQHTTNIQAPANMYTVTNNYLQRGTVHWPPNSIQDNVHSITKGYMHQQTAKLPPPPYPYKNYSSEYNNYSTELSKNSQQKASFHSPTQGYMAQTSHHFYPSNNHSLEQLTSYNANQLRSVNYLGNQTPHMHPPNVVQATLTSTIAGSQLINKQASDIQQRAYNLQNCEVYNQSHNNFYAKNNCNVQPFKQQEKYELQQKYPDLATLLNNSDVSAKPDQNNLYMQLETSIDKAQETRNTLSRDSGFMSPEYFNISDEVLNISEDSEKPSECMPIITHITSLNPSAVLLDDGKCVVCGIITKNKCLRCYIKYYCSYDCQKGRQTSIRFT